MRKVLACCIVLAALVFVVAGCGSKKESDKGDTDQVPLAATQAACNGTALTTTAKLPPNFPTVSQATYTKESTEGPTDVTEGFFMGSVKEAHSTYTSALGTNGYQVTHDELDEHDSEVNWKGHGRTGQVAIREQCGESDKVYLHVTNRPA